MSLAMYSSRPAEHHTYPRAPPSPPMDDAPPRCSLPSISNLLVMADAGSPTAEHSPASYHQSLPAKLEMRPNSSHYSNGPSKNALPLTPPMSSDISFDGRRSPSSRSPTSSQDYFHESTPPADEGRRLPHTTGSTPRSHVAQASYSQRSYAPTYATQPPPPMQPNGPGPYYQRPLPAIFPPTPVSAPLAAASSGNNPWQHHHYISPTSAASFPQSQDRYICPTCNKAFSRPSSLRIHSHSHTGEKPFKCPHNGCGKAFSVRSNMKRHERGCHSFDGTMGMH